MRNNTAVNSYKTFVLIMVLLLTIVWSSGCGTNTAVSEKNSSGEDKKVNESSEIVVIPDPVLKERIQSELGIGDRDITEADALSLTSFSYDGKNGETAINDITGLSAFTNLTELDLSDNQISNISELSDLTKLTSLDLSNNPISDISALSGLTNLKILDLSKYGISDKKNYQA